jgi:hypothetical protein
MKIIGDSVYVHITNLEEIPEKLRCKVDRAKELFQAQVGRTFQLVKVSKKLDRVSLLCYPRFWRQNFPELTESWLVDLAAGTIQHRQYNPDNPLILHRRELFVRKSVKQRPEMERVTRICEDAGCFADTKRIGYKKFWDELLRKKAFNYE